MSIIGTMICGSSSRGSLTTANSPSRMPGISDITTDINEQFLPELQKKYPGLTILKGGSQEEEEEFFNEIFALYAVAFFLMYTLIAIAFHSYSLPLLIMTAIPFGFMGAVFGHLIFDLPMALLLLIVIATMSMPLAALLLTPLLYFLPKATLAATIIVAVMSLIDIDLLKRAWHYSRSDFIAVATTIVITLLAGVELGVLSGILASISLHLHKTSQPHFAVVGAVPGTAAVRPVR